MLCKAQVSAELVATTLAPLTMIPASVSFQLDGRLSSSAGLWRSIGRLTMAWLRTGRFLNGYTGAGIL